jgi:hypothetical protein
MNDDTEAPYRLPDAATHPAIIAERVMRMPEHQHLVDNEIEIDWLMRTGEKIKGGRRVLGSVHEPACQGEFKDLFQWMLERLLGRLPRFLVILDLEFWEASTAEAREILIFHELCHIKQKLDRYGAPRFDKDGLPVYGLKNHDVEEFTSVVARYGAHTPELAQFVDAARGA